MILPRPKRPAQTPPVRLDIRATPLDPATPVIHPDLGDNLTFERTLDVGEVDKAFAESDAVVEQTFIERLPQQPAARAPRQHVIGQQHVELLFTQLLERRLRARAGGG